MYCTTMETDRTNITMSMDIIEWLDKFLKSDKAKQMGFRSRPDVFTMLLRDFLTKEFPMTEITQGKNVIIKDEKSRTFLDIDVSGDNEIHCNDCDSKDCKHVKQVLSDKKLMRQLKKDGLIS